MVIATIMFLNYDYVHVTHIVPRGAMILLLNSFIYSKDTQNVDY